MKITTVSYNHSYNNYIGYNNSLHDCAYTYRSHSQQIVDEDGGYHEQDAGDAEVGEAVCMRPHEERSAAVCVKYTPEQSTQRSHQCLCMGIQWV